MPKVSEFYGIQIVFYSMTMVFLAFTRSMRDDARHLE
jgi:hypothetical protein